MTTTRVRAQQPIIAGDVDTWGQKVNANAQLFDDMGKGVVSFSVNGTKGLSYSNDPAIDEAHYRVLKLTGGTGGQVILQPQQGQWLVHNLCEGDVLFTVNGTTGATVEPGIIVEIYCDGSSVHQVGVSGDSMKAYVDAEIAEERAYVDAQVFAAANDIFPGQTGNAGKFLTTDGTTASFQNIQQSDVQNLPTDLEKIKGFAIAVALVL